MTEFSNNLQAHVVAQQLMTTTEAAAYLNLNNYMLQSVVGAAIMGVLTSVIVAFFLGTTAR
ncbi:hypothetical protein [Arsukibacterium sp.]|uniref:hypothetical protein n=1 Tax=Arsukibacterium sp. TaxID=1977258 RepID=UPI002FDA052E